MEEPTMNDHETATLEPAAGPDTFDEVVRLPDDAELVDGQVVAKNMGTESSYVGAQILFRLVLHVKPPVGGWVLTSDAGYRCFPRRPKLVRKPDVSFIRPGRLPGERLPQGDTLIPPDLAVEVVSPNDLYYEVDRKVSEYLDVNVPMIWVVNPDTRSVLVYLPGGVVRRLSGNDEIDGGDVLPGFRCRLSDFFPPAVPIEADPSSSS
jgi:Uma2 family endonuclease